MTAPGSAPRDSGAALILAIGFVVMIGAISAGLAALVTSSASNRGTLEQIRDRQYAADGAIEQAITQVRLTPGAPLSTCAAGRGVLVDTLNRVAIRVEWQTTCGVVRSTDGTVVGQHNVMFSACLDTGTTCASDQVIISSQVNFEQGPTGAVTRTYVQSWSVGR